MKDFIECVRVASSNTKEPLKVLSSLGIINYLYLPSTVLIAQVLVGPSKQLKQIKKNIHLSRDF